jgi:hypothetical protein
LRAELKVERRESKEKRLFDQNKEQEAKTVSGRKQMREHTSSQRRDELSSVGR